MKRTLLYTIALTASFGAGAADNLSFDGNNYRLSHVGVNGSEITNKYLPAGKVNGAFSVRAFKGRSSTAEVIDEYVAQMRNSLVDDPLTIAGDAERGDVVLLMFRKTADKEVVEYDLQRFVRDGEGVISYAYAERIPRLGDVRPVLVRQPKRIDQLLGMKVALKEHL